jgi:predicted regulator of Ras-like GTPase activity (Roadblock/LC7/MglB family)
MDLGASIWLSSVTGALLFFFGGRLWGKAVSQREVLAPAVRDDGAALARAEHEAVAAQEACAQVSSALETELATSTALQGQLALAEKRTEGLRFELTIAQARAEDAAWLGTENIALRREVEERRLAQVGFADVQRRNVELATQAHLVERRRGEIDGKEAENEALRRDVERLSIQAREVEELRAEVRDLTARGFALHLRATGPAPALQPARPKAGQKLEEAIDVHLDELRRRRGSCKTAVLADVRGLLLASCGDATHDEALAAAVSMITETSERVRRILPLGEPLEIRLVDVNHAALTARWLRDDQETFLVGTLGVAREKADPRADTIEASISDLLRAPAPTSSHVPA